jgi:uncharacterized protein DUF1259
MQFISVKGAFAYEDKFVQRRVCVLLSGALTDSNDCRRSERKTRLRQNRAAYGVKGELNGQRRRVHGTSATDGSSGHYSGSEDEYGNGLKSYAAFIKAGANTMVMGDTTLLEDQVNPVMSAALDNGLEVTALHNHFFWDSPKVMFMHIGGMGDEERLASAVGKVFAKIKDTSGGKGEVPKADLDRRKPPSIPKILKALWG